MARAETHGEHGGGRESLWTPDPRRIHVEPDPSGTGASQLRHARYPYLASIPLKIPREKFEVLLFEAATAYIKAANPLLKLPDELLPVPPDSLSANSFVVWTPIASDLRSSYWLQRFEDPQASNKTIVDSTAVLLATLGLSHDRKFEPWYGGQGMQVLAHFSRPSDTEVNVRFTSVSHTLPRFGKAALKQLQSFLEAQFVDPSMGVGGEFGFLAEFEKQYVTLFGLPPGSVPVETGVRISPHPHTDFVLEVVSKTAPPVEKGTKEEGAFMPQSTLRVGARMRFEGPDLVYVPSFKFPMVSHATADVLPRDPVTQGGTRVFKATRPYRQSGAFTAYVQTVQLWNVSTAPNGDTLLKDSTKYIEVKPSMFVDDTSYNGVVTVPNPSRALARSNEFAAVNAYVRATDFIQRVLACGLDPVTALPYVTFPLAVRYRGGIHPGRMDGNTVNAQVRWLLPPTDIPNGPQPGTAEVSLALADLRLNPKRVPLGIAADARWAWHEWSHVMLAGRSGLLEFPFAHSAGDALAAIISDPDSGLADDLKWRGVTFPWVTVPDRYHDRDVHQGWGWAGWFYQRERDFAEAPEVCDKSPYWSEQIQSSSLFQMYRSLGGDAMTDGAGSPTLDRAYRRAISDYSTYLILRAIATMPSASTHLIDTPDKFVKLLDDADAGTETFVSNGMTFIGGAAGKVIRWAYQHQGLYTDPNLPYPVNAPGLCPDVDLYIEDKAKRKGGYQPLSYLKDDWHAARTSMLVVRKPIERTHQAKVKHGVKAYLLVFVRNCGRLTSYPVTVRAWVAPVAANGDIPPWRSADWQALFQNGAPVPPTVDPETAGGPDRIWTFEWTPTAAGQEYALFAEASSGDDSSNIDPLTGLPCASVATGGPDASAMPYLVGCDNNLGLIVVET
jgi:hypothetical protein